MKRRIGRRVAERRKRRGLTQEQLAEAVGVSVETIGRIERGETAASLRRLERVAAALDCDVAELVRAGERSARRDRAVDRVLVTLRARPVEDVELVADVLAVVFRTRP